VTGVVAVALGMVAVPVVPLLVLLARRWPAVPVCLVPLALPVGQLPVPGLPVELIRVVSVAALALCCLPLAAPAGPARPDLSVGRLQPDGSAQPDLSARQLRSGRSGRPEQPGRGEPGRVHRRGPADSGLLLAAGVMVLAALVSTVASPVPAAAFRLDLGYLLGLGLVGAIVVGCPDLRSLRLVLLSACAGGGTACAMALLTARPPEEHYGGSLVQNRATGMFGQPNELGTFAAVVAVLALATLLSLPRRHPLRLLAGAVALLGYLALAASLSRGGWIGAALGLLVLVALLGPDHRRRVVTGLAAIAGGTLLVGAALPGSPVLAVFRDRAGSLLSGQRNPYDDRPAIWREAWRQWAARPMLGGGPGSYPVLARPGAGQLGLTRPDHAHSLFLTVGTEQGVLGVAVLLLVIAVGVAGTVRATRRRYHAGGGAGEQELLAGAAAGLCTVLGQGLVDFTLRNPVVETLTWLLVGLLAAACRLPTGSRGAGRDFSGGGVVPASPSMPALVGPPAGPVVATPLARAIAISAGLAERSRCSRP
jgi:O-antigen ligase